MLTTDASGVFPFCTPIPPHSPTLNLTAFLTPLQKSTGTNRIASYLPDELILIGCQHRTDSMQPEENSFLGRTCVGPFFLLQEDRTARPNGHQQSLVFDGDGHHCRWR